MPRPIPYIAPRRPVVTAKGTRDERHDERDPRERHLAVQLHLVLGDVEAAGAQLDDVALELLRRSSGRRPCCSVMKYCGGSSEHVGALDGPVGALLDLAVELPHPAVARLPHDGLLEAGGVPG